MLIGSRPGVMLRLVGMMLDFIRIVSEVHSVQND